MLGLNITQLPFIVLCLLSNSFLKADDTIVVTADRIKTQLDKSPSDIKVFEAQDIEKATSVTELLSKESDLKISQSGPPGSNTSLFLRGSDSSHTLVIIDGIVMNDPSNPNRQFDLGRLSLNNIERIEILKGSQGLLYGSNAIGGVILITSKVATSGVTGSALIDYGTFDTLNSAINVQQKLDKTSVSFGIDHFRTTGLSAANKNLNPNADDDGEERSTISTGIVHNLGTSGKIVLNYREVMDVTDLDKGGGAGADDPNDSLKTKQKYMKAGYNYQWAEAETQVAYTKSIHTRDLDVLADPSNPAQSLVKTKGKIDTASINHTQFTTSNLTQNINFDYQHEEDGSGNFNENYSLFLYNRYELNSNIFNFGLRGDSNKFFGEHLTYKAAYLHNFDPALLKMSYSTGFRAPSLNQLYDPTYGNKNLDPEESQTAELGFEIPFAIHKYNATVFYTELENRLSYNPTNFVNMNRGRARIVGLENIFDTYVSTDLKVSLAATWMKAMDMTARQKLARRPSLSSKLTIVYEKDQHTVEVEADYTGKRPDVDNLGGTVEMPAHMLFNLSYHLFLNKNFSTYLRVKNVLDKDYEDVYGYGTGGRAATLGMKYLF